MKSSLWSLCFTLVSTLIMLLLSTSPGFANPYNAPAIKQSSTPYLQGSFLQLLNGHGNWDKERWNELFGYLKKMRISRLVLQWSVHDQVAFYPSASLPHVSGTPPLDTILTLADAANIEVWIGLIEEPEFWKVINKQSPTTSQEYLKKLYQRSKVTATELRPILQKHRSFKGWYIPQEIDDLNWRKPETQAVLFEYLNNLSLFLNTLSPQTPIAISGFANNGTDPKFLESFWSNLLQSAPNIDSVLFQDSIGVAKLTLENIPPYLHAIHTATRKHNRSFYTVIEIFKQTHGYPINKNHFLATPAPLERIMQQLALDAAAGSHGNIAFSIPEYMTPQAGSAANALYEAYLNEINKNMQIKK